MIIILGCIAHVYVLFLNWLRPFSEIAALQNQKDHLNKDLEKEIVREALQNPRAFAPLYECYYERIFRFIQGKVQRMDLAGELTSNVFIKAMINLKKYEDRGFPFSSWLYRIASNEVADYFRKTKRTPTMEISEEMMVPLGNDLEEKSIAKAL